MRKQVNRAITTALVGLAIFAAFHLVSAVPAVWRDLTRSKTPRGLLEAILEWRNESEVYTNWRDSAGCRSLQPGPAERALLDACPIERWRASGYEAPNVDQPDPYYYFTCDAGNQPIEVSIWWGMGTQGVNFSRCPSEGCRGAAEPAPCLPEH